MLHPSHRYITFLCSQARHTAQDILALLVQKGLPVPRDVQGEDYQELLALVQQEQRAARRPPHFNLQPGGEGEEESVAYLRDLGVLGAWRKERFVQLAFNVLERPPLNRMLQVLLLSPLDEASIAKRCTARFTLPPSEMNSRVVRSYGYYFWDTEALDNARWNAMLSTWFSKPANDMRTALNAPRTDVGAALALAVVNNGSIGSMPEVGMYRYMRDTAFMEYTAHAAGMHMGQGKATSLLQLTQAIILSQEQLDARRGGSAELLDELRKIEAEHDQESVSSLADLSRPGKHAVIDTTGKER